MEDATASIPGHLRGDMNKLELKKRIVERCGDYSLVIDRVTYADNGVEVLIDRGQRYLDQHVKTIHINSYFFTALALNQNLVHLEGLRSLLSIDLFEANSDVPIPILYTPNLDVISYYLNSENVTIGTPYAWTYMSTALTKAVAGIDLTLFDGTDVVVQPADLTKTSIILGPAADKAYTLRAFGRFYTPKLLLDTDTSYWTVNHEGASEALALYYWALSQDNKTLADRYLAEADIDEITKDSVEAEESEGAWEII